MAKISLSEGIRNGLFCERDVNSGRGAASRAIWRGRAGEDIPIRYLVLKFVRFTI